MTAPLLATRDAVEAVLRTCRMDDEAPVRLLTDFDVHHVSHMLFASGVLRDPATLADDETLSREVWERLPCTAPVREYDVPFVLRALAAALTEDPS